MGILNLIRGLFNQGRTITEQRVYQPAPKVKVYGSHGRLEIPNLFISVPLYDALDAADRQRVVDNPDSAVHFRLGVQDVIADHTGQANFQNLNLAKPGMTATIDRKTSKTVYRMVQSQVGHIRISPLGNRLFDQDWVQVSTQNAGGLCIYTCMGKSAEDVMDVRLTYWQPANEN